MKKFFQISLAVLALFTASVAHADDMDILVKVAKENSKWVSFITNDAQRIDLTLYAANEEVIYEQQLKTVSNKFKTYDLSALPEGNYTLKMESIAKITTYNILITDENAIISKPSVVEIKRPVLTKKDDIITLDLNGVANGAVEVTIYNEYSEKLHEDAFADESKTVKKFDVSKTIAKELTFVVKSGNQQYSETIKL